MFTLLRWLWGGQWRASPGRAATAVVAIAIGVALGLGVHLVNRSALEEFGAAIAVVNGDAQLQLRATTGNGFDEAVYPLVAADPRVRAASPVIEFEAEVLPAHGPEGDMDAASRSNGRMPARLRVIALDPLRAAEVTPGLMPVLERGEDRDAQPVSLFDDDAVFLSAAAMQALQLRPGEVLQLRAGLAAATLRIAGSVPGAAPGQVLAVMDVGSAQWRLQRPARLSRIDLRLAPGTTPSALAAALAPVLPADATWSGPDAGRQRMSNLSRAYRVNLNVLALVALFTGGFIVYTTIALGVVRQQQELALLGVLGAPRRLPSALVLGQGAVLGAIGALLGVAAGVALAAVTLALTGGDLGGGYFRGSTPALHVDAGAVALFAALGMAVGLAGSALPARALRALAPASALKSGSSESTLRRRHAAAWSAVLAAVGAGLLMLPPVQGLPLAAYAAIAAWLLAGIVFVPLVTRALAALAARGSAAVWRRPALWLAVQRIRGAPGSAATALAGVVASVALATAMAIMVHSFRGSVEHWLDTVLPADLYGRAGGSSTPSPLDDAMRARIAALPGVAGVEFLRALELELDPARPPVTILARPLAGDEARARLPLTGALLPAPAGTVPIHVSEAMVDLYGFTPGRTVSLPLGPGAAAGASGGHGAPDGRPAGREPATVARHGADPPPRYFVAGVWRDYARQHGAIAIDAAQYRAITGDRSVSELAIRLAPGASAQQVLDELRARLPQLEALEFRSAGELRELSLRIFDRSFAVTYALEAIAIVVGLFGVAAAYAGEAIARRREFGMLRHLGLTRGDVVRSFALESALLILAGVAWGAAVGVAIAAVLVHRVNPQSFHWTMDMAWPLPLLAASACALIALGVAAAVLATRSATAHDAVRAVREDW